MKASIVLILLFFIVSCKDENKVLLNDLEGTWSLVEGKLTASPSNKDSTFYSSNNINFTFEKCTKKNGTGVGDSPCKVLIFNGKGNTFSRAFKIYASDISTIYLANINDVNAPSNEKYFDKIWNETFEIIALTENRLVISTASGRDYLNKRFEFGR